LGRISKRTRIEFSSQAQRDWKKLRKKIGKDAESDFNKSIEAIANSPLSGKPLQENLSGHYGFRFGGHYRIVYEMLEDEKGKFVSVCAIDDRKNIYRKRL
jgi:addiction module RelE/StbE family toxin